MINIFEADLQFEGGNVSDGPRVRDIMAEVVAKIQILNLDTTKQVVPAVKADRGDPMEVDDCIDVTTSEEYEAAVRLFKTG